MLKLSSLVAIFLLSWSVSSVSHPHSQDEFFHQTFNHKFYASVFFDSKRNQFGKKLVERLVNDLVVVDFIKARGVELAVTDIAEIPMLRDHYDINGSFALFFYINNQLQRFGEFSEFAEEFLAQKLLYADLLEESSKFLRAKLDRLNAPLKSVEEFRAALSAHKIIGVFLGGTSGFFFDQYTEFATRYVDFHFFHAANNFVADQIHQLSSGLPRPQDYDLFAIIRDSALLDDIDTKALVAIDARKLMDEYKVFFEYERFPKLRDATHGDDIFFRLYNANQKLVLYVYNDQSSLDELNQFKKAVFMLPRIFIFAHVNTAHPKFGSFMQMFIQAGQNPTENRVYIFHGAAGKLFAQAVPATIQADKLVEAVGRYFQHHRALFSDAERALVGDSDSQEPAGEEPQEEPELVYQEL